MQQFGVKAARDEWLWGAYLFMNLPSLGSFLLFSVSVPLRDLFFFRFQLAYSALQAKEMGV